MENLIWIPIYQENEYFLQLNWTAGHADDEQIQFSLTHPQKNTAIAEQSAAANALSTLLPCGQVAEWSADTPTLYQLTISSHHECVTMPVAFRHIERKGRQVFWNNKPLKLRGLNYREPKPEEGRDLRKELILFKEAHVNYLRGMYYPYSDKMLALCDELGFYVENMAPVRDVGQAGAPTQSNPALRDTYLAPVREMVKTGQNHVSVLIWSIGTESTWGDNMRQCYRLIKEADAQRLVNFHFPMTIPEEEPQMDVWSVAHNDYRMPFDICYDQMIIFHTHGADTPLGYATGQAEYELPVLHVEYAHLPCYNRDQIDHDPGIHDFWGRSIHTIWKKMLVTPGCLGGAVMAAVDEMGGFDPKITEYRWGILDVNGNPKPEYYHLKRAYGISPFQLVQDEDNFILENDICHFEVSKTRGLIVNGLCGGAPILAEGPQLVTTKMKLGAWQGQVDSFILTEDGAHLVLSGSYGKVCSVRYDIDFGFCGELAVTLTVLAVNQPMPHIVKANIGLDRGGLDEYGIRFRLASDCTTLSWEKEGIWNYYPDDHIGRLSGQASKARTADFCGMKHNLYRAFVQKEDGSAFGIYANGQQSLRMELQPDCRIDDRDSRIQYDGTWFEKNDYAGNYMDTESMSEQAGDSYTIPFIGTGISLYGPKDIIMGLSDVYIDDVLVAENISQYPDSVDFPGMSRGYEKRYQLPLFDFDTLEDGRHTCRVVVKGAGVPGAQAHYVSLDYAVIHDHTPDQLYLILNTDYNYTRLVRGNYMRDQVVMQAGDTTVFRFGLIPPANRR